MEAEASEAEAEASEIAVAVADAEAGRQDEEAARQDEEEVSWLPSPHLLREVAPAALRPAPGRMHLPPPPRRRRREALVRRILRSRRGPLTFRRRLLRPWRPGGRLPLPQRREGEEERRQRCALLTFSVKGMARIPIPRRYEQARPRSVLPP